jgi:hypothetical protein
MAYFVTKSRKPNQFRIIFDFQHEGRRRFRTLTPKERAELGFKEGASQEELRATAAKLNAEAHRLRWDVKREKIKARLKQDDTDAVIYLPEAFERAFIEEEIETRKDKKRYRILWRRSRRVIKDLGIDYLDWKRKARQIFQYLAEQRVSPEYAKKIRMLMNLWGEFLASRTGKLYAPIPRPRGAENEAIADAYFDRLVSSKESEPITPDDLQVLASNLPASQYRWMFVSVWFGLRPLEIDRLSRKDLAWREEAQDGMKVLVVYQSKLTSVPREQRWKYIPVLFPEQDEALAMIKAGDLRRPLPKTLKRYLKRRVHLYGGRKNFQDLMISKGRSFFEIQAWLGHTSVERTWKSYRNKMKVLIEKK